MIEDSTLYGSGPYGGFYYLAQVLYASRRLEEAEAAAEKARGFQPTRPGVIDLSANIARRLGNLEEALTFSRMHLELEPSSEASRERLQALVDQEASERTRAGSGKREGLRAILSPAEGVRRKRARS